MLSCDWGIQDDVTFKAAEGCGSTSKNSNPARYFSGSIAASNGTLRSQY